MEADLVEFFRTLRVPAGRSPVELLRLADEVMNADLPDVGAHHHGVAIADLGSWRLTADLTVPCGPGPFPVLLYLHGGAWTMGSPHTHRRLTADLADAGLLTVSLDYRRAPKFRFPAPVDDAHTALAWIGEHIAAYGGDPTRLALGGDSAGANIAGGALVGDTTPPVGAALLLYGAFDYHAVIADLDGDSSGWPPRQAYVDQARFDELRGEPRLSPVLGAGRFPPTYLAVGSEDPLLGESIRLARELDAAGIDHVLAVAEGLPHGFFQLPHLPGHGARVAAAANFVLERLQ